MNPVDLKYYPFMISLNQCNESWNVLSAKICAPKETKDINFKAFNMIANKSKTKTMTEHISCNCKCKFNSTICNSKPKQNNSSSQCECKSYRKYKKDYSWNPSTCIYENRKYLISIADTSVTECDEIIVIMDIVSTKKANAIVTKKINTISTNVTSTASLNIYSKKVRDDYVLHTVSFVIIVLLIIFTI